MAAEIVGEFGTPGASREWISAQETLAIRHLAWEPVVRATAFWMKAVSTLTFWKTKEGVALDLPSHHQ